jgi:hypothetical protein
MQNKIYKNAVLFVMIELIGGCSRDQITSVRMFN